MPIGAVGTALAECDGGWMVAGGEYSPSLRTAQVHRVALANRKKESSR